MKVAHRPEELATAARIVAIGSFDGVHLGHRRVLETAQGEGTPVTVVTFQHVSLGIARGGSARQIDVRHVPLVEADEA